VPAAALAFQWSARVQAYNELHVGFLRGCFLISSRVWDSLGRPQQEALRAAHAKLLARLESVGRAADDRLLNGLFEKQGLKRVPASSGFRTEFFEAARQMRERLGDKLVPPALLSKALGMLADYRAEHAAQGR